MVLPIEISSSECSNSIKIDNEAFFFFLLAGVVHIGACDVGIFYIQKQRLQSAWNCSR